MIADAPAADAGLRQVAEAVVLVRTASRLTVAALAVVTGLWLGPMWAAGALAGGVLLEANLTLLISMIRGSKPGRLAVPLWITVVKFNLAFLGTMAACLAVVKFRLGHPLAFLLALMALLPSMALGLIAYSRSRAKAAAKPAGEGGAPASGS
jgi:hypothetical protein